VQSEPPRCKGLGWAFVSGFGAIDDSVESTLEAVQYTPPADHWRLDVFDEGPGGAASSLGPFPVRACGKRI
jgi:hypothetical protein